MEINWNEAPEWAMYHWFDSNGCGWWLEMIQDVHFSYRIIGKRKTSGNSKVGSNNLVTKRPI